MSCSWVDPVVPPYTQQDGAPGLRLAPISHFGTQPYIDYLSMLQVPTRCLDHLEGSTSRQEPCQSSSSPLLGTSAGRVRWLHAHIHKNTHKK